MSFFTIEVDPPIMPFDSASYGADVERVLAFGDNGRRLMKLTCGDCVSKDAQRELSQMKPEALFPGHREPGAPMAGLWLYFSCFEEAHRLVDDPRTADGIYWHA